MTGQTGPREFDPEEELDDDRTQIRTVHAASSRSSGERRYEEEHAPRRSRRYEDDYDDGAGVGVIGDRLPLHQLKAAQQLIVPLHVLVEPAHQGGDRVSLRLLQHLGFRRAQHPDPGSPGLRPLYLAGAGPGEPH